MDVEVRTMVEDDPVEHARRLEFFRGRLIGMPQDYVEEWLELCRRLLTHGGAMVVPGFGPDPDVKALLSAMAVSAGGGAELVLGEQSRCHTNAAAMLAAGEVDALETGYALSVDGLWRCHSWARKDGRLVETTAPRVLYAGVTLSMERALELLEG
jgi:hypothetical protein